MDFYDFPLPIDDYIKELKVGCSGCGQIAPFILREFERGDTFPGWQLRLLATEVLMNDMPARSWRWDLFCPACAGEMSPRPANSLRIRVTTHVEDPEDSE